MSNSKSEIMPPKIIKKTIFDQHDKPEERVTKILLNKKILKQKK